MNIVLLLSSDILKKNIIKEINNSNTNYIIYDLSYSNIYKLLDLQDLIHFDIILIDDKYKNSLMHITNCKIKNLSKDTQIVWVEDNCFNSVISEINQFSNLKNKNYNEKCIKKNCYSYIAPNILLFVYKNNYYKICANDIIYFEMLQKNLFLRLSDHKINVGRIALKDIKSQLNSDTFCYCNQSYIVNMDKIKSIENNSQGLIVTFNNVCEHVYLTNSYKHKIIKKFAEK